MRIALDVRYRTRSGASSYILNILPHLLGGGNHDFVLIRYSDQEIPGCEGLESILFEGGSRMTEVAWDQVILPRRLRRHRVDLYHAMKLLGPLRTPCLKLTVAHSITTPFRGDFPASSPLHAMYWNVIGNRLYRTSDHVIAVSEYVKDFVVEELGIGDSSVSVILHGIDPAFMSGVDAPLPPGVREPFLLMVGNLFPVKNQLTAVRAFARIASESPDLQLVLAGKDDGAYAQRVREEVFRLGVDGRVVFPGFVGIRDLIQLYGHCELLLMPSRTEGCPVTLLEGMASGAAVLASARGGIPEVGGDAVSLLECPDDDSAWARRISDLLKTDDRRSKMRTRARERAARFSWPRAAAQTLGVYARLEYELTSPSGV